MRLVTLAAGFATGYVLGTRAGREKYEQIAATTRKITGKATDTATGSTAVTSARGDTKPRAAGIVSSDEPIAGRKPEPLPETETPSGPVTYTGGRL
ncbi:hypothetical protein AB0F72_32825 [Actinoplanes sp. NPDC023936]|uniref:hypothetical protein n=1 Tax=Actinoplanes sp. NPDC023936 TaxID=3154910 RepID=UPI0033F6DCBF